MLLALKHNVCGPKIRPLLGPKNNPLLLKLKEGFPFGNVICFESESLELRVNCGIII